MVGFGLSGTLGREDRLRARDREAIARARAGGGRIRLLLLFLGPGVLAMIGENDGPSMLSYAASGATYGIGFFVPFIVVTFAAAVFVQDMGTRVSVASHRGFGELIFQRFGPFWGWVSSVDLVATNLVTLIAEVVAIRVGLSFFGVAPWVAVLGAVLLVTVSTFAGSYDRWESIGLSLAAFNLLFVAAAVTARPSPGELGRSLATWTPLPGGGIATVLLLVASNIGATVTPWMLFFQQSATSDKGLTRADLGGGRTDTALGGVLAVVTGIGALLAAVPLFTHHMTVTADGGAGYASALEPFIGRVGSSFFALGLVEAGALAVVTISASTAYAVGESSPGGAHSFNDSGSGSRAFHLAAVGLTAVAGAITLIPGAPLLAIALNANVLATVLMPAALVFLLLLANDAEVMGDDTNGRVTNTVAVVVVVIIIAAGAASVLVPLLGGSS